MGAKEALPEILNVLKYDESSLVRSKAILALEEIGAEEAISALIYSCQNDSDHMVRRLAVWLLGECCEKAKDAVPALIKVMQNDSDEVIRGWAARSLAEIDAREAIPAMIKGLDEKSVSTRWRIAYALGLMGAKEAAFRIEEKMNAAKGDTEKFHMAVALARLADTNGVSTIQKGINTIQEMKDKGELDVWYFRNFEQRLCDEFNLDDKLNQIQKNTESLRDSIQKQNPSIEKNRLLEIINNQENVISEFKLNINQMITKMDKIDLQQRKESRWWSKHSGEIIIGLIGFLGTLTAALLGVFF